jgi:hypothetical protein
VKARVIDLEAIPWFLVFLKVMVLRVRHGRMVQVEILQHHMRYNCQAVPGAG